MLTSPILVQHHMGKSSLSPLLVCYFPSNSEKTGSTDATQLRIVQFHRYSSITILSLTPDGNTIIHQALVLMCSVLALSLQTPLISKVTYVKPYFPTFFRHVNS